MTCQFIVTLNGVDLCYPSRALAEEFKASFEENLWNEVSEVEFRPQDSPIIIPVDDITHTAEWPQCKDPTCPCQLEVEDVIADVPPSEASLDEQERRVSIGTRVLIEVEIRGFYAGNMMIAGGWMPLSRIKAIVR